jgi:hypothetical protein
MRPRQVTQFLMASFSLLTIFAASGCVPAAAKSLTPQYYSPLSNANYVSKGATIAVRYGPVLSEGNIEDLQFTVTGSTSGLHTGKTILADDQKTVIFEPADPFTPGEQVKVRLSGLSLNRQTDYAPLAYTFTVAVNQQPGEVASSSGPPDKPPKSAFPDFLTVPQDIPHFTVTGDASAVTEGDIFVAPFYWTKDTVGSYLLILTPQGKLVYYQYVGDDKSAFDFKKQPNGLLSYYDLKYHAYYLMNSNYNIVDSYTAGDGYTADLHELQILPNGDALLMAYDTETIDMSKVVPGGKKDAAVTGLVIQELDPSKNVIFEWRSWDHFQMQDSTSDLTQQQIDLVHGNALALASDGNLLLSSRNQSEVTKINLQTGAVIWRLGGKANQFKFIGGKPFAYQHDVSQLPNGDITIFDNQGTTQNPAASSGIEYKLDETKMTATVVWQTTHDPPVFGTYMGDTQRLPDGNTFIDWGAAYVGKGYQYVTLTELGPDNSTLLELSFDQPYVSYRAFIFPWQGFPDTQPALAFKAIDQGILLGYSWNGATNVAAYEVYGGSNPQSLNKMEENTVTDFEAQSILKYLPATECYFQVAALDGSGNELSRSKVISTDEINCPTSGY